LPSDGGGLLGPLFAGSRADAELSNRAWLRAMLDAERALAVASARVGIVPEPAAAAIAAAGHTDRFDPDDLGRRALGAGNPVVPLVRDLTAAVTAEAGPEAARWVHHGATSQDILDTAASLVAARALGPILDDLDGAAAGCARLAEAHRDTFMAARTLDQQALPTTFGLKAAGWLAALDEAADGLDRFRRGRLAAQLGGAAGTLAALGPHGVEVAQAFAAKLGLAEPVLPWHTDRARVGELAGALGVAAGALGKLALDVTLLAQTELGEVAEAAGGGSSTLPHKRNPVGAVLVRAACARVPGLVATLLGAMAQEQERATGAWQAEWEPLAELLRLVGGAAARARELLEGLEVHPDRMRANLEAADGGRPLREVLLADPTVRQRLDEAGVDRLLDPAGRLVDRALAAHRAGTGPPLPTRRGSGRRARLAYELGGTEQAPVLVLANSMGTTMAMWYHQLQALEERFRVLFYDHRGHGGSDLLPGPSTMEQLGGDLLGLLDDLGLDRVSFCGLSLGGMVGMWLAANAPDRVDRLVLCCTSARVDAEAYLERAAKVRAGGTGSVTGEVLERWFTPAFRERGRGQVAWAAAMLTATPDEGYAGCCEAIAAMDLRADLPRITAPTLVLAGRDDPATPPAHAEAIVAAIAGARLEVVPGAAHLANIEQPGPVTRLLLEHLTDPYAT
jgi:3-carboxy-cis,cis-muconate cycloisomerase/3-oxoadipate enol-lactonase